MTYLATLTEFLAGDRSISEKTAPAAALVEFATHLDMISKASSDEGEVNTEVVFVTPLRDVSKSHSATIGWAGDLAKIMKSSGNTHFFVGLHGGLRPIFSVHALDAYREVSSDELGKTPHVCHSIGSQTIADALDSIIFQVGLENVMDYVTKAHQEELEE